MYVLADLTLDGNKLFAVATISNTDNFAKHLFYLYKDGNLLERTDYNTKNTYTFALKHPGIYYVVAFVKIGNDTYSQASKTIEYFDDETKQSFKEFLNDVKQPQYLLEQRLGFVSADYPYCDFALISMQGDVQVNNVNFDGFEKYDLPTTGNWCNVLIANGAVKKDKRGAQYVFSGITTYKNRLIFGADDFDSDFLAAEILGELGSYTMLFADKNGIRIFADYFNICHLFYYKDAHVSVVSNRYHLLLEVVTSLGIKCFLDYGKAKAMLSYVRLPEMYNNFTQAMDIDGMFQLESFKDIVITQHGLECVDNELFADVTAENAFDEAKYEQLVRQGVEDIVKNMDIALASEHFDNVMVDLSGGMDSRTTYAAITNMVRNTEKIVINTQNTSPADLKIATCINNAYKFNWNALPSMRYPVPIHHMDQITRSFFMGTNFEHNMHTALVDTGKTLQMYGAGGDTIVRPYRSRRFLGYEFDNIEQLYEYFYRTSAHFVISDYNKAFHHFEPIFIKQLKNMPVGDPRLLLDFSYLGLGNGYHFEPTFKNKIGINVWSCIQSKALWRANLMSYSVFKDIKLHMDVLSLLNADLALFPYDSESNNQAIERLGNELLGGKGTGKISEQEDYTEWEKADELRKANTVYTPKGQNSQRATWEQQNIVSIEHESILYLIKQLIELYPAFKEDMGLALYHFVQHNKNDKRLIRLLYNKLQSIIDQLKIISPEQTARLLKQVVTYISFYEHGFHKVTPNMQLQVLSQYHMRTVFESNGEPAYIQQFDGKFNDKPSAVYESLSNISGYKTIAVNFTANSDAKGMLEVFFMEYNQTERISITSKRIELINGENLCELTFVIGEDALFYKLALKYIFESDVAVEIKDMYMSVL